METKVKPIPRHEIKHIINVGDYCLLQQRLSTICQHDRFTNENGQYKIRSLYFDNDDDKALKEKLFGISKREKFRIRYYNDDLSFIKLEKKSRSNSLCYKEAATITQEEAQKIINHDIEWMRSSKKPLLRSSSTPKCVIRGLSRKQLLITCANLTFLARVIPGSPSIGKSAQGSFLKNFSIKKHLRFPF